MKEGDIRKSDTFNRYLELVAADVERLFPNAEGFEETPCLVCDRSVSEIALTKGKFQYVECPECRTIFVNPRPSFTQLSTFYRDSESTSYWVNEFFAPVAEARREKIFRPRAEYISKMFPDYSSGHVGDIGSGFGLFLEELGRYWPQASLVAIEPSREMATLCRNKGIVVLEKMLEDLPVQDNQFDLLTSFELFEHLHDPAKFLADVGRLLRPGGVFYFTTLNGLGFDIQVLWEKSKSLSPPHHLNFFNPVSIAALCEKVGFEIVEVSTPGELDWDIVEGMYQRKEAVPDRFWRLLSDCGREQVKCELQNWIKRSGFSSHMRVVVRRK